MEMRNGFATMGAMVDRNPVACPGNPQGIRQFPRGKEQVPEDFLILHRGLADPGDHFFRNDENMGGCLRGYVTERAAKIILVEYVGRDFAIIDFFEKSFHRRFF